MTSPHYKKEKLTIMAIGKRRFWSGLISGLVGGVCVSLGFNYTREVLRTITSFRSDLFKFAAEELVFFDWFFVVTASILGLSLSLWIWMGNHTNHRRKDRIFKQYSRANLLMFFWVIIMIIARLGYLISILVHGCYDENYMALYDDFWLLFILLPFVLFSQNWQTVRLVYKTNYWVTYSGLICALFSVFLYHTTTVNQGKVDQVYALKYAYENDYLDEEVERVKSEHQITFAPETLKVLKQYHTVSSHDQIRYVKEAFEKGHSVSLDTVLLQKFILRNFKRCCWELHERDSLISWHYALPRDVLNQIYLAVDEAIVIELIKIVEEQIEIMNSSLITEYEMRPKSYAHLRKGSAEFHGLVSEPMRTELRKVRTVLIEDPKFYKFSKDLEVVHDWLSISFKDTGEALL